MPEEISPAIKQDKSKKYVLVRYGRMNELGFFEHEQSNIPKVPCRVVVKTDRGQELGDIVGQLAACKIGQFKLSKGQVKKYFDSSQIEFTDDSKGSVIRLATAADIREAKHLRKIAEDEMEYCKKLAAEMNLPMKIVDADHILGGERIIFYFMAETRVDFRELVKRLAHEYQLRIEMHQIGSRDEAKLLGDLESCGQECCCIRFLKALNPVNMRMAKMQKATLDPAKISGYCGRLKCCLRYEDLTYTELKQRLPHKNTLIKTSQGKGRVLDGQILSQLVIVEYEDGNKAAVPVDELEILGQSTTESRKNENPESEEQNGEKMQQ